jgi:restriction endonuclease Mrr
MKAVRFHPDAESEMTKAAAYYETQQPDLGRRFLASVQDAVNHIDFGVGVATDAVCEVKRLDSDYFMDK